MSENSRIAWCDHTFNPWWGCTKTGQECVFCYAEVMAHRLGLKCWGDAPRRLFGDGHWNDPRRWDRSAARSDKRAKVFCGSMCDIFEDEVPGLDEQRMRLWKLIEITPALDWLLLTKRPENIERMHPFIEIGGELIERFDNVWFGTTVGCRSSLPRVDELRRSPATVRFLSIEPLLEDLGHLDDIDLTGISWVIVGCESGPNARPMEDDWVRSIRDQCRAADVAFFFKQAMREGKLDHEPKLDGRTWRQMPEVR